MLAAEQVIPPALRDALRGVDGWFLIGGQAVRCFRPYRPSRDVDMGVRSAKDAERILGALRRRARVSIIERSKDTIHLRVGDVDVSIFVLPRVARFVEAKRLNVTGILATKLHALLDRGTRRDFFDLYVMLHDQRLSITDCFAAMREVYGPDVNEGLLLRALAFFDDAEQEARLPGEGARDWTLVKRFFQEQVGRLLIPPQRELAVSTRRVEVGVASATRSRRGS
jgi:hypothetical protein